MKPFLFCAFSKEADVKVNWIYWLVFSEALYGIVVYYMPKTRQAGNYFRLRPVVLLIYEQNQALQYGRHFYIGRTFWYINVIYIGNRVIHDKVQT